MKKKELIDLLHRVPEDAEICAYDADNDRYEPITGAVTERRWDSTTVNLTTDIEP